MKILLTGGTGLIGQRLCRKWQAAGHQLWVWSRRPQQVPALCRPEVKGIAQLRELNGTPLDAVVNLAGAPIADGRWTRSRKALLWGSRVSLTQQLVNWLETQAKRPELLISASAAGWYGDTGEVPVDESYPLPGNDFCAHMCASWEGAAHRAEALGMRVVYLRTGLVLATEGGFLKKLLPMYRRGMGGRLGDGRQWLPWLHIEDEVALIDFLLQLPDAHGPYNLCTARPVRNAEFTQTLARAIGRPALIPVPAFALKAMMGEMAMLALGGQRLLPMRAQEAGFVFAYPELGKALDALLAG